MIADGRISRPGCGDIEVPSGHTFRLHDSSTLCFFQKMGQGPSSSINLLSLVPGWTSKIAEEVALTGYTCKKVLVGGCTSMDPPTSKSRTRNKKKEGAKTRKRDLSCYLGSSQEDVTQGHFRDEKFSMRFGEK